MNELHLQNQFVLPFFRDTLKYQTVKANTISTALIIEEDLQTFIAETDLNRKPYQTLLKKYRGNQHALLADVIALLQERIASSRNMALCINNNKSITMQGVQLHMFYTSDSVVYENALFAQNIFSIVSELPYQFYYQDKKIFSFRPDLAFFVNGIYLGYSELKSNYNNQTARKNGRGKVIRNYFDAVFAYHQHIDSNSQLSEAEKQRGRKELLKIFEKAIHISATDMDETYVIRTLADFFDEVLAKCRDGQFDRDTLTQEVNKIFKPYPLQRPEADKKNKLKELFTALYSPLMIEKEILYYNFIEREVQIRHRVKEVKNEAGRLISPRPKQKFGTDKILSKIDELLAHEHEPDYFEKLLDKQLIGVSAAKKQALLEKRRLYANNKHVYSLLMQYAAGFGKSNIIGWTALQLKDLRRNGQFVYDKIMVVVDRLQLRGQIDSLLLNMNIEKRMVLEATNKKTFQQALTADTRLVIVNLQKFGAVQDMLDTEVLARLAGLRIAFLIDEIHRSNSGKQHEEMVSLFDELQQSFDRPDYAGKAQKKNLIIGFTATPDDHALARFGEYSGYAEHEKLWRPFDSYTMREAIEDGFVLNPLNNIVSIASKMSFALPSHDLNGSTATEYKDAEKKQIYLNHERIDEIARWVVDLLVKDVYRRIRGTGKAMLAVYSIKAAIIYHDAINKYFRAIVQQPKYAKYANAPIYTVYSSNQDEQSATVLNAGRSEDKVLQNFAQCKNGLIIVVDKLQTGFDERRLHTLFLDKEIRGISAIQTISRVNRTTKYKNDCKIIDFSHEHVNVHNIQQAFEQFADVVVSDFDPFGDEKVLAILFGELKKSDVFAKFFKHFCAITTDQNQADESVSYLDFISSLEKYIAANPQRTADIKAKAAQYFGILNRIEYVITLEAKYNAAEFLQFWRKFNQLYNQLQPKSAHKDPIEVYFDNQIGIVEVATAIPPTQDKQPTQVAEGSPPPYVSNSQLSILAIIAKRNAHEAKVGELIEDFENKVLAFFDFVRSSNEGIRLITKIKSHVSETEIDDDFAKIYRRYKVLHRRKIGDAFFKETEDLVNKLCDDFETSLRNGLR